MGNPCGRVVIGQHSSRIILTQNSTCIVDQVRLTRTWLGQFMRIKTLWELHSKNENLSHCVNIVFQAFDPVDSQWSQFSSGLGICLKMNNGNWLTIDISMNSYTWWPQRRDDWKSSINQIFVQWKTPKRNYFGTLVSKFTNILRIYDLIYSCILHGQFDRMGVWISDSAILRVIVGSGCWNPKTCCCCLMTPDSLSRTVAYPQSSELPLPLLASLLASWQCRPWQSAASASSLLRCFGTSSIQHQTPPLSTPPGQQTVPTWEDQQCRPDLATAAGLSLSTSQGGGHQSCRHQISVWIFGSVLLLESGSPLPLGVPQGHSW